MRAKATDVTCSTYRQSKRADIAAMSHILLNGGGATLWRVPAYHMQAKGAATLVSFVQHFSGIADIASVTESMIDFQTEAAVLRRSRDFCRVIRAQYQFVCQREAAHVCRAFRI